MKHLEKKTNDGQPSKIVSSAGDSSFSTKKSKGIGEKVSTALGTGKRGC